MSDWIPATRESAGYYAEDPPKCDLRTCRERQDEAIADLQVSVGYAQAADVRLAREIAELRARVAALETLLVRVPVVGTVDSATGAITWTDEPPVAYAIMEPVRDDALDDEPKLNIVWDRSTFRFDPYPDDAQRTATPNQTYSWLPGDAWDQYCADAEGEETP